MTATNGALATDINQVPASGLYSPNTGTTAAQGGTAQIDSTGGRYAPTVIAGSGGPAITSKAGNTSPTLSDIPLVTVLSPANTGLPVNNPTTFNRTNAVSTGSVASLAKAFTNPNTAGNSIVVVAGCGNGTAMTVADSNGNTYTQAQNAPNSTTFETAIFYAVNIAGGNNTVTVTNAGTAASMSFEIYEVSGLIQQVQAVLGQTSTGTGTGTTASTSAIAPSVPNALVFAGVSIGTGVVTAFAAGSGLNYDSGTLQPTTPAGLFQFASLSGYIGNISGISPSATWTTSQPWAMVAAIFKPVTLPIEGTVRIGGYNYTRVTSTGTTLIKTGPGVLHAVAVNKPTSTATIELDDAVTNTNPIGILGAFAASIAPFSMTYDVTFMTGLSVTVGVAAVDATIIWK